MGVNSLKNWQKMVFFNLGFILLIKMTAPAPPAEIV